MSNNKTFNITHILKFPIINYTQLKTNATSNNKYSFGGGEAIKLWVKEKSLEKMIMFINCKHKLPSMYTCLMTDKCIQSVPYKTYIDSLVYMVKSIDLSKW